MDPVATAPFAYVRMHAGRLRGAGFNRSQLRTWAAHIRAFRRAGLSVYVYFNNDWLGNAVKDALALKRLLRR